MKKKTLNRLPLLALVTLLAAGCAAPDESRDRDHPDAPEDATTGDGDGPEQSLPHGGGATNESFRNDTPAANDTSGTPP